MSIWERMARVARSELSEMKRVLADRDVDPTSEAATREAAIAEAEAELARAERDVLAAEIEMGAAGWGGPTTAAAPPADDAIAKGASLWASGDAAPSTPAPAGPIIDATHGATQPAARAAPAEAGPPRAIPTEIRDAHAALELPLGANADAVRAAHAELSERFHPDRFGHDEARVRIAAMVKARIDEARDRLLAWLAAG